MSRRVATITLNPAYDLVGYTPEIERGEVNLVKTTGLHAAGKGINVAKVLKDLQQRRFLAVLQWYHRSAHGSADAAAPDVHPT